MKKLNILLLSEHIFQLALTHNLVITDVFYRKNVSTLSPVDESNSSEVDEDTENGVYEVDEGTPGESDIPELVTPDEPDIPEPVTPDEPPVPLFTDSSRQEDGNICSTINRLASL